MRMCEFNLIISDDDDDDEDVERSLSNAFAGAAAAARHLGVLLVSRKWHGWFDLVGKTFRLLHGDKYAAHTRAFSLTLFFFFIFFSFFRLFGACAVVVSQIQRYMKNF